ncbi:MAG: hypothetical protein ACUVV0_13195 [Anaerolineae bacterium]
MVKLHFTKENMPSSSEEFMQALKEAWEKSNPIDDFVEVVRELTLLERQYGMTSQDFYEKFQRGELGDESDFFHWATRYEIYLEMKETLEKTFELLQYYAFPIPTWKETSAAT